MLSRVTRTVLVMGLVALLGHATAGSVGGAPAPGHQDIFDQITTWSQTLPAADRFVLVMAGAAVLDKETGLVWEQAPASADATLDRKTWFAARSFCNDRELGNRKGWRLPTVQELASLVDLSVPSPGPRLPVGHPFDNVQPQPNAQIPFAYWSATSQDSEFTRAWFVDFSDARVFTADKIPPAGYNLFAWCVRGGHAGTDAQ